MNKSELLPLLAKLGVHPSRRLGQNFLVDGNMLDAMVRDAAPQAGESILEVGPGTGVLTRKLIESGVRLTAVEFDHRLAAHIRDTYGRNPGFRLVEADACKLDYDELMGTGPWRCIANLPYSCGSVFLAHAAAAANPPGELFILLQLEMGERLAAKEGGDDYGALTVQIQSLYQVELRRKVPGAVFHPPPDVDSAFLALRRRPDAPVPEVRRRLIQLAKAGFGQRRKKLFKLIAPLCGEAELRDAYAKLGISEDARAEELAVATWLDLARLCPVRP